MSFCRTITNVALLAGIGSVACAGEVSGLASFSAGTTARASEVNGNFAVVKSAVDDNHARLQTLEQAVAALKDTVDEQAATIGTLESTVAALSSQLIAVQNSGVMALGAYLTVQGGSRPTAVLSGVNLQLVNGMGVTSTANGLGNLIIGYDEPRTAGASTCSIGEHADEESCTADGGIWAVSHKSGSHYVVVGPEHNYSQYGGLLAGYANSSTGWFASATGGVDNRATGHFSSVSGGQSNTASGQFASVSGGGNNTASGVMASASGGGSNTASGPMASVSGGNENTASADFTSVSGGELNVASGSTSSVSGGYSNTASGILASMIGGFLNDAAGPVSSVTGGTENSAAHEGSTVGGGQSVSTSANFDWASGP